MAYEVVTFQLRDEIALDDSLESVLKKYILDLIVSESGVQRAYWGTTIENPRLVKMFVHWDSVQAHYDLQKKDYYMPFVQKLNEITDLSKLTAFHTHVQPHPADQVLHDETSPVTEIFMAYFPKEYSETSQQEFGKRIEEFLENCQPGEPVITGFAGGWAVEDDLPFPNGGSDQGTAFLGLFGWKSVEDHSEFAKTDVFKENAPLISKTDGLIQTEVVHYRGRRFK